MSQGILFLALVLHLLVPFLQTGIHRWLFLVRLLHGIHPWLFLVLTFQKLYGQLLREE
jgi:hypothetical protein